MFLPWLNHMAYAACLYLVGRAASAESKRIADILFAGWAASVLFDIGVGGDDGLLFRMTADTAMAVALARRGIVARRVALCFWAAIRWGFRTLF